MEKFDSGLHWETVTPLLRETLKWLAAEEVFNPFVLVGGTNLSLRFGHRKSVDIDLFTPEEYGSLDFNPFEEKLKSTFPYFDRPDKTDIVGFGRSYYIGESSTNAIKLDLMYTDPFISPIEINDGIRMASVKDIAAMKISAICGSGRKKDFWDIHMLLDHFELEELINFYFERHPYESTKKEVLDSLIKFAKADEYLDPICLLGKDWDIIKMDLIDIVAK